MKRLLLVCSIFLLLSVLVLFANTPGRHSVQLSWTPSTTSGALYNVYLGSATGVCAGAPTPFATGVASPSYLDTNVQAGTYVYAVSAYSPTGGESTCTAEVQVTVPSVTTLPASNLQATSN